jgi:hypothetical protein
MILIAFRSISMHHPLATMYLVGMEVRMIRTGEAATLSVLTLPNPALKLPNDSLPSVGRLFAA